MQVADATVAVLIERLEGVMATQSRIEGMLQAQSAQLGAIPVIQAQLSEHGAKFDRAFKTIRENDGRISSIERTSALHTWILKAVGGTLALAIGLVGWFWGLIQKYDAADNAIDRRTLILETKLGVAPPVAEGEK